MAERAVESVEQRALPRYVAGGIEVPFVIRGMDELVVRDTVWGEHSHPTHELLWNEKGASTATIGPRTWTITRTLGLWIPAGVVHAAAAPAGTWYRTAHFGISAVPSIAEGPTPVEITPLLALLLERLASQDLSNASRKSTETVVLDLLVPSSSEMMVRMPQSPLVRPIVAALQADPADERSLDDWAAELGTSGRTITRVFRTEAGHGFARWRISVRAQHAAWMLSQGADMEDVAAHVGYGSVSAFGAAFRRVTGLTPGAFRTTGIGTD